MMTKFYFRFCERYIFVLFWTCLTSLASAQTRVESATQQLGKPDLRTRLQTPASQEISSLYEDEDKDVGPQMIVRQKPRHNWFEASADVQLGTTSNVSLTEDATTESSLMISTAQVAVTPPAWTIPGGQLSVKAGYRHQKYNYGIGTGGQESEINLADFDISTLFIQWRYGFLEKWVATVGLDHNRLLSAYDGDYVEFYTEFAPTASIQRSFELTPKSGITANIGVGGHISQTDGVDSTTFETVRNDEYDRIDESATVSYVNQLFDGFVFQSYYRALLTQYTQNHVRKDIVHTVGVVFAYSVTQSLSLRVSASAEQRESSDTTIADYQKVDTGVGLSFLFQF